MSGAKRKKRLNREKREGAAKRFLRRRAGRSRRGSPPDLQDLPVQTVALLRALRGSSAGGISARFTGKKEGRVHDPAP
jgi:hypothetical protein